VVNENGEVSSGEPISFGESLSQNICSVGQITSECSCGGEFYSDGFCCSDNLWNPVSCNQDWNVLNLKDFNNGVSEDSIYSSAVVPLDPTIVVESNVLKGNLASTADKRGHRLQINLGSLGVEPNGEFYLESKVKLSSTDNWCCVSLASCRPPVSDLCPEGIDGAKFSYAFGKNGVSWIPSTTPNDPLNSGGWAFNDNRGDGSGTNYVRYFGSVPNLFDDNWHTWTW